MRPWHIHDSFECTVLAAPKAFKDYVVAVDDSDLPAGVTLTRLAP